MKMKLSKNFNKIIFLLLFFVIGGVFLLSSNAQATDIVFENPLVSSSFEGVAKSIIGVLKVFVAGIAIAVLIIAGIMYIFSQGNEDRVASAKKMIIGAVIGLVIILGAETFLKEIYAIFNKTSPDPSIDMAKNAYAIVEGFLALLLSITGMLGIVSFIWGALIYFASAGNEDRATKAKKQMIYSVLGLVIAIGSLVIVKQIATLLQ
jgi:hypothetical protein